MAHFRGGMEFAAGRPLRLPAPPPTISVPGVRLRCHERPEVIQGQALRPGQVLLRPTQIGSWYQVSPLAGTVRSIDPVHRLEGHLAQGVEEHRGYEIVIEAASPTSATSLEIAAPRGRRLDAWFIALRQIGSWSDRDGGVGFIPQLAAAQTRKIDTVVCVGLDAFPPYPDASSLLLSFPDDAVLGTIIVSDLVSAGNAMILAPDSRAIQGPLGSSCRNYNLKLAVSPNIYPAADPMLVAWTHAGKRKLPRGVNPATRGMILLHPWTAIRIGRWFTLQRFDLVRPIFLAWPGGRPALSAQYAMPGQPLRSLDSRLPAQLANDPRRVLLGNPMTGRPVAVATTSPIPSTPAAPPAAPTVDRPASPALGNGRTNLPTPRPASTPIAPEGDAALDDARASTPIDLQAHAPADSPADAPRPAPAASVSIDAPPAGASAAGLDNKADRTPVLAPGVEEPTVPDDELLVSVIPREPAPAEEPCITCGWCVDVCPTALRPIHLATLARTHADDDALLDHLDWCMECGLCSHVCPSSIPLTQTLRQAAHEMAERHPGRYFPTVSLPVKNLNISTVAARPAGTTEGTSGSTPAPPQAGAAANEAGKPPPDKSEGPL